MLTAIIACEVGFWVMLGLGLACRYILGFRRLGFRRLGMLLLACVPLVDLILLVVTVIDLMNGAIADQSHGLAAVYLGTSIVFGPGIIRWADRKFAGRFARASAHPAAFSTPKNPAALYGAGHTKHEWREFGKALLAGAISAGLLGACILLIDDPSRTEALTTWFPRIGVVLAVWAIWPISYTVSPRKPPAKEATEVAGRR